VVEPRSALQSKVANLASSFGAVHVDAAVIPSKACERRGSRKGQTGCSYALDDLASRGSTTTCTAGLADDPSARSISHVASWYVPWITIGQQVTPLSARSVG
jgi:hypothetical protein